MLLHTSLKVKMRHVELAEGREAFQRTTYIHLGDFENSAAWRAVDGDTGTDYNSDTCTHTDSE